MQWLAATSGRKGLMSGRNDVLTAPTDNEELKPGVLRGVMFEAGRYEGGLHESKKAILQCPAAVSHRGQTMSSVKDFLMLLDRNEEVEARGPLSCRN